MVTEAVAELPAANWTGTTGVAVTRKPCPTVTLNCTEREREPAVPVTVTMYVPKLVEVAVTIVRVDEALVPGVRLTVGLLIVIKSPAGAETPETAITPVKPRLDSVIVEVEFEPAWKVAGAGGKGERRGLDARRRRKVFYGHDHHA